MITGILVTMGAMAIVNIAVIIWHCEVMRRAAVRNIEGFGNV